MRCSRVHFRLFAVTAWHRACACPALLPPISPSAVPTLTNLPPRPPTHLPAAKTFEELGLSQELLQGLYTEMKFERPSRIQVGADLALTWR